MRSVLLCALHTPFAQVDVQALGTLQLNWPTGVEAGSASRSGRGGAPMAAQPCSVGGTLCHGVVCACGPCNWPCGAAVPHVGEAATGM